MYVPFINDEDLLQPSILHRIWSSDHTSFHGSKFYSQEQAITFGFSFVVSWFSSVSIVHDYGLDDWGSISGSGKGFFL
jgi:hypothetical protein